MSVIAWLALFAVGARVFVWCLERRDYVNRCAWEMERLARIAQESNEVDDEDGFSGVQADEDEESQEDIDALMKDALA